MLRRYFSIVLLFNGTISSLLETRIVSPFNPTTLRVAVGSCYDLRLNNKSKEESCIEFTQENLIKFLVQKYLSYICWANSLYYTKPSLP